MLVEVLENIVTKKGPLFPGQLAELPEGIIAKLGVRVKPLTFDKVHGLLDRLGDWTGITDLAAKECPTLLEAARQTYRDVDRDPALIGRYFQAWRELFLAVQRQQEKHADERTADTLTHAERSS